AAVDEVASVADLVTLTGRLAREGVSGFVQPFVNTDDKDSSRYVVYLEQGGLGLPDESYYRESQHEATVTAYRGHVARLLALATCIAETATPDRAEGVLDLATRRAEDPWDGLANRGTIRTYTLMTADELAGLTPQIDWAAWAAALGADPPFAEVVVRQT